MATWIRGTPRSSAGPCSRTAWCLPRQSDSPGNMQRWLGFSDKQVVTTYKKYSEQDWVVAF